MLPGNEVSREHTGSCKPTLQRAIPRLCDAAYVDFELIPT